MFQRHQLQISTRGIFTWVTMWIWFLLSTEVGLQDFHFILLSEGCCIFCDHRVHFFITDGFRQNLTKQMVLRAAGKRRPKVRQPQKPKSARASSRSSAQRGRRQVRNPCLDPQPLIIHALKEAVFTEVRGVPSLSYGICSVEKTRKRGATRGPRSPRT